MLTFFSSKFRSNQKLQYREGLLITLQVFYNFIVNRTLKKDRVLQLTFLKYLLCLTFDIYSEIINFSRILL